MCITVATVLFHPSVVSAAGLSMSTSSHLHGRRRTPANVQQQLEPDYASRRRIRDVEADHETDTGGDGMRFLSLIHI